MSWVTVTKIDDLIDQPKGLVEVQGKSVGILRDENRWSAAIERVSSQSAPICEGRIEGRVSRRPIV